MPQRKGYSGGGPNRSKVGTQIGDYRRDGIKATPKRVKPGKKARDAGKN